MSLNIHTFQLVLDWNIISLINELERFDASWVNLEKKSVDNLKQLKFFETIRSVGASTRIEGSRLKDDQVEELLNNLEISMLEDRDSQEVVGYYDALELIHESYSSIKISEGNLKNMHNILMKYSDKDSWHRGEYKQHSNAVEATLPDGSKRIIFNTTKQGAETITAMESLINWYNNEHQVHPFVKCAIFTYEFLSIHPFQDGNGRMSRLLTNLILLQNNFRWVQFVSFEHEIEKQKINYYRQLQQCQNQRPNEDISPWVNFFLIALRNLQEKLQQKLNNSISQELNSKENNLYIYIDHHPGSKSSEISKALNIPLPTVKRLLSKLLKSNLIQKAGGGRSTNYTTI